MSILRFLFSISGILVVLGMLIYVAGWAAARNAVKIIIDSDAPPASRSAARKTRDGANVVKGIGKLIGNIGSCGWTILFIIITIQNWR